VGCARLRVLHSAAALTPRVACHRFVLSAGQSEITLTKFAGCRDALEFLAGLARKYGPRCVCRPCEPSLLPCCRCSAGTIPWLPAPGFLCHHPLSTHPAFPFTLCSVSELLERRREQQARYDTGETPHFLPETKHVSLRGSAAGMPGMHHVGTASQPAGLQTSCAAAPPHPQIREGDWRVAPLPADFQDRRVEITGPTDRKMVINALNRWETGCGLVWGGAVGCPLAANPVLNWKPAILKGWQRRKLQFMGNSCLTGSLKSKRAIRGGFAPLWAFNLPAARTTARSMQAAPLMAVYRPLQAVGVAVKVNLHVVIDLVCTGGLYSPCRCQGSLQPPAISPRAAATYAAESLVKICEVRLKFVRGSLPWSRGAVC
jgi:hypothetical protein